MKKVVIKYKGLLRPEEVERVEAQLKQDLERNNFLLVDDKFDVFVVDDDETKGEQNDE